MKAESLNAAANTAKARRGNPVYSLTMSFPKASPRLPPVRLC